MIDVHSHCLARAFLDRAIEDPGRFNAEVTRDGDVYEMRPQFWSMAKFTSVYRFEPKHYDWAARVAAMDDNGVETQVVTGVQSVNYYWAEVDTAVEVVRMMNDDMAEASENYPGRLYGLASLPAQDVQASIEEVDRAVAGLGLRGVQLLSNINEVDLDDRRFDPLYARIEELGVPIFVHPYGSMHPQRMERHFLSNVVGFPSEQALAAASVILGGVLDRFPKLKFLFGHGGGSFLYLLGRIDRGFDVLPELQAIERRPRDYLASMYVDTLIHDDEALTYILRTIGPEHVVLGTDWPYWMEDPDVVARVQRVAKLESVDAKLIFEDNARKLFGLEKGAAEPTRDA